MTALGLMKNTNGPSMASAAAQTKNGRMGWVKNLFIAWLDSALKMLSDCLIGSGEF